jgi:TRAP-type mannitol/chloroaromatic compound transport system permease small subunit
MPNIIKYYIKFIDYISLKTGRATMYLVFVMMFILILSFVTRNIINIPLIWIIEMAQFVMTGYYLLGGGYSMLTDDHVRMDLIYSKLKDKTKALLDSLTSVFLIFYLVVLLIGSISSLTYTLETNQRLFTAWAPYVWPIKSIMTFGILLMLLQSIAIFFKDIAKVLNREI